jgi:hypothetical protein
MSFTGRMLQHASRALAEELRNSNSEAHQAVGKHLDECKVTDCNRFSVGGVCSQCSRHACTAHLYLTAAIPPALMCTECILLDFEVDRSKKEQRTLK